MFPAVLVAALRDALAATAAEGGFEVPSDLVVEVARPRDPGHGDWSTNLALAVARPAGRSPRDVAAALAGHLPAVPYLDQVEVAGPGFLNFRLSPERLLEVLRRAAAGGPDHARSTLGAGERVQVEFVSANPNGPLHIGHGRGGVLGDALANLLDYAGYSVGREYYFNDAGVQIDRYTASLEARYLQALGRPAEVPEDGYHGEYLADWGRELAAARGEALTGPDGVPALRAWGLERAMRDIRETLALARIRFDVWFSERTLHEQGEVEEAVVRLERAGHVYLKEGATWLRSTDFGDEKDRVLLKSDGTYTYIAPDIAYHLDKFRRGFERVIDVWGADHHGYVGRMRAAVAALGFDPSRLEMIITQLVNVVRGGEPVRMSTRKGEFVTFREVLEEVGPDAARYYLVAFSPDTTVTFDLELAKRRSMDNPVYYLQYAHARMCSLERVAAEQGVKRRPIDEVDLAVLTHPAELEVMRQIDRLGEEVEEAARRRAPHRMAAFGYEFAGAFHRFYTDCRILTDDPALTQARLWLVEGARSVLVAVLAILGISAPESM